MPAQTFGEPPVPGGFESPFEVTPGEQFTLGEGFTVGEGFEAEFEQGFEQGFDPEGPAMESEVFPSGLVLTETTGATGVGQEHWDPNNTGLPLLSTGPSVRSQKLSPNFTVGELVRSGGVYADPARISPRLVELLQRMRERAGKPVKISSGYRSWKRNGVVYKGYGKPPTLSRHCSGQAADISIAGYTGMQIAKLAIDVWGSRIGVGIGGTYAHVDVRPTWGRWTYLSGDASRRAIAEIDAYRRAKKSAPKPPDPIPPVPVPPIPVPIIPGTTGEGSLVVPRSPLLASHRGTHPDLIVGWNAMSSPATIDVVVHLHGHSASGAGMRLDSEILPISGLGLGARSRPTLTILPRGDFYGGESGRGYDFPALTAPGRIDALIASAMAAFTSRTGVSAPRGRLILTAHSGGGKALLAILRSSDPDEVFVFDALYQSSAPLGDWMERRVARQLTSPSDPPPAMRVIYRAGGKKSTAPSSEALARRLGAVLSVPAASVLGARFRVERTSENHGTVAKRYGSTLLGDAGANLSGTTPVPGMQQELEAESFTVSESFAEPESLAWDAYESELPWMEGESYGVEEAYDVGETSAEGFDAGEALDEEGEGFEPEYLDTESPEAEHFDTESPEAEYLDTEYYDTETPEAEFLDTEFLDTEYYDTETFDTEAFDTESTETEEPAQRFAPEALDTEVVSLAGLVAEEFEDEEAGAWSSEAEQSETAGGVTFPSGLTLAAAPAAIASQPGYADPNNTGLPLLATPPSTHRLPLATNFVVRELASTGGKSSPYSRISPDLVRVLQAIRSRLGRPVYVDSGYRRWAQALAVAEARGGHPRNTRHASGQAADIRVIGLTGQQLAQAAIDAVDEDLAIGIGSNYIHVDVRGTWKLWTYIPGAAGLAAKQVVLAHHVAKKGKKKPQPQPQPQPKPGPQPQPIPTVDARFSVIKPAFLATADPALRTTLLQRGLAFAATHVRQARKDVARATSQTSFSRARITAETGVGKKGGDFPFLEPNPFAGTVTDDRFEQAYRAWAENPAHSIEPWLLMAIWVKEGLTTAQIGPTVSALSAADARSIWRSSYYYVNMGIDHYVAKLPKQPGQDNLLDGGPGSGVRHDAVFRDAVRAHVKAGRLPRDVTAEIDAELSVSAGPAGTFSVTPTSRFFVLSLMLVDAFWREMRTGTASAPGIAATSPTPLDLEGLTYLNWNMPPESFKKFRTRNMSQNPDPDGTIPSLPVWAFHREVKKSQFGQPRANAIRLQHTIPVYKEVYEG